jgi:hypothetical protein
MIREHLREYYSGNLCSLSSSRTTRTIRRTRKRWIAGIEEDLQIIGVRRWRKQCEERVELKKTTEKAKTHSGLKRQYKKKS